MEKLGPERASGVMQKMSVDELVDLIQLLPDRESKEFLKEGYKVKVEMFLRGRERANKEFARKRFVLFLSKVAMEHKVEQPIKQLPSGFITVLGK